MTILYLGLQRRNVLGGLDELLLQGGDLCLVLLHQLRLAGSRVVLALDQQLQRHDLLVAGRHRLLQSAHACWATRVTPRP